MADLKASLVITASSLSPTLAGVKLKAIALRAVCDYVPAGAAASAVREELPALSAGEELPVDEVLGALAHSLAHERVVETREFAAPDARHAPVYSRRGHTHCSRFHGPRPGRTQAHARPRAHCTIRWSRPDTGGLLP